MLLGTIFQLDEIQYCARVRNTEEKINDFCHEAETAFKFLEEKYGYQYLGQNSKSLEEWRDAEVFIYYISKSVGIWISWGLSDTFIGVTFFETIQPQVFPERDQRN